MELIDDHTVFNVLSKLDIGSIIRFSRVNKVYNRLYHEYAEVRKKSLIKVTDIPDDGHIIEYTILPNGIIEGISTTLRFKSLKNITDPKDNIHTKRVEEYIDGFKHGTDTTYDKLGRILIERQFINGKLDGILSEYGNEDGYYRLKLSTYKKGKLHGISETYYNNGSIKSRYCYRSGKIYGEFSEYYYNGNLMIKGSNIKGNKEGTWYRFYDTGITSSVSNYVNGYTSGIYTSYTSDGTLSSSREYNRGVLHGYNKEYYRNGTLSSSREYNRGRSHGDHKEYNEDGTLYRHVIYDNGAVIKTWM